MKTVCALDHFAGLVAARPGNTARLLALDPATFISAMARWREAFLERADQAVMGFTGAELRRITIPTVVVPYDDKRHPYTTVAHAHKMIPGSLFFDFDPSRGKAPGRHDARRNERDEEAVASILCTTYTDRGVCRPRDS